MIDAIAATGDAGDIHCWSGIPYHFAQAARTGTVPVVPWRLAIDRFSGPRRWWNLRQVLRGRGAGGYQYSRAFLDRAEAEIPAVQWRGRILSFNQHFPRGRSVGLRGGRLVHYIDATFFSGCTDGGFAEKLTERVRTEALALERENYAASEWVVTMSRWAAESAVRDCAVPSSKVATILPGANLTLPPRYDFPAPAGRPGRDRPVVLGFVGKDWKRKGLPFLLKVRAELERMDLPSLVRCAGYCPAQLSREQGIEYVGFIDKERDPARFLEFLASCDVGCLFSEREPLGISTLEFLRAGVPVAGFVVEGVADTLPPDAGFRLAVQATPAEVATAFCDAFRDSGIVERLRTNARKWSPSVTWERCLAEWRQLLTTGAVDRPVQPWRGLAAGSV